MPTSNPTLRREGTAVRGAAHPPAAASGAGRTDRGGRAGRADRRRSDRFVLAGLALFALYSVFPLWWLVVAATKDQAGLYQTNGLWFSRLHLWSNLHQLFTYDNGVFLRWVGNSFLYAGVGSLVGTAVAMAAGYGLARYDFPGKGLVFAFVVGSFLVPTAMLTLPLYLLFSSIGLVDTPWAVLLPCFVNPFSVYLAKVYTESAIPREVIEAARIDGAGELRIFVSIVLRMMTTGGATVFLLAFVGTWNSFFLPLTMLRGEQHWTLTLGLFDWTGKRLESGVDLTSLVLTGALLTIIPLMVIMIAMRRYWRTGVAMGSIK